jgi:hypothetical protein
MVPFLFPQSYSHPSPDAIHQRSSVGTRENQRRCVEEIGISRPSREPQVVEKWKEQ